MRVSKMYDWLLQMGRWFGYRHGYVDLCRIYTTPDLIAWYRHIALAEAELRREFERMTDLKATPEEYGLRVRTHPDGMMVTALNKARASQKVQVSYEGTLAQCVVLHRDRATRDKNRDATAALISRMKDPVTRGNDSNSRTRVWSAVEAEAVCGWLDVFRAPMGTNGFDSQRIAQFVRRQQSQHELVDWTVALISNRKAEDVNESEVANLKIGLVKRKNVGPIDGPYALPNSNVLNPPDQAIDLEGKKLDKPWIQHLLTKRAFGVDQLEQRALIDRAEGRDALEVAHALSKLRFDADKAAGRIPADKSAPKAPLGTVIRDLRPTRRGLLLIYPLDSAYAEIGPDDSPFYTCALSFPTSATALPIEYQVNEVYRKLHLDRVEDPDSED